MVSGLGLGFWGVRLGRNLMGAKFWVSWSFRIPMSELKVSFWKCACWIENSVEVSIERMSWLWAEIFWMGLASIIGWERARLVRR